MTTYASDSDGLVMQKIHNAEGELVPVLDLADLNDIKNAAIKWLAGIFATCILGAVALGVHVTQVRNQADVVRIENEAQNERMQRHEAQLVQDAGSIAQLRVVKEQMDSLRIVTGYIAKTVERLDRNVTRAVR